MSVGLVLKYPSFSHTLDIFQEDSSGHFGIHLIGIRGHNATASLVSTVRGLAQLLALTSLFMLMHTLHFSYTPISFTRS